MILKVHLNGFLWEDLKETGWKMCHQIKHLIPSIQFWEKRHDTPKSGNLMLTQPTASVFASHRCGYFASLLWILSGLPSLFSTMSIAQIMFRQFAKNMGVQFFKACLSLSLARWHWVFWVGFLFMLDHQRMRNNDGKTNINHSPNHRK